MILKKSLKSQGGAYFREIPGSTFYSHRDIYNAIRNGDDIKLVNCYEDKELISIIRSIETNTEGNGRTVNRNVEGDTALMNRIIRGGGFCSYVEGLENLI